MNTFIFLLAILPFILGDGICVPADNTLILLELHFQLVLNFFSQQKHCTFGKEDRRIPQAEICTHGGFPGGAVVESLPANAGDTGLSPGLGRSHMPRSSWASEPQLLSLRVWSLCSAAREAAIVRGPRTAMKSGPRSPQLKKALAQKRRPNTAINQSINQ